MPNTETVDQVPGTPDLPVNAAPSGSSQRAMALLLVAHAPFVMLYYWHLFAVPPYRFFPLALIAFVFLFVRRRNPAVERWNWFARFLLFCDVLCLSASLILALPWLAVAGMMLCLAAVCMTSRAKGYTSSLLSLAVIPLTTLRVAGGFDLQVLDWLRDKCFLSVSKFCHRIDLIHYMKDDSLFFAEKTFSSATLTRSAEALFLTLCLAAIIAAYRRRSFLHSALVVICGGVIAASLTLIRAVAVLWLWNKYSVDLAMGPAGIVTDVFLVVIAAACLVSADALLNVLSAFVPDIKRMGPVELFWNPFIYLWNRWAASAMPNPFPSETPLVPLFPRATAVFATVLVISLIGQIADLLLKRVV